MDQITEIPLEQLHESPFNPRKTFVAIDELATDIKAQGRVLSPLLVRPRLTNPLRDDQVDGYEIVFGHRRYRAAELAGLATVPCMVRAMSAEEAKRAQISENLQRKDVHPIEEAEGFQALMDDHGITAEQIVEQTGKSRSYVYGRLKLLQAVPQVRDACLAAEIGSEVALLIARLRTGKLQEKALAAIKSKYYDLEDGGAKSFRQIRALLNEKFSLELAEAIFPTSDALLLPDAGACTTCPKRTGNAPEFSDVAAQKSEQEEDAAGAGVDSWDDADVYADSWKNRVRHGGPDVCTDPECFEAKKKAHLKNIAARLESEGKTVIDGAKARQAVSATGEVKGAYVAVSDLKADLKKKAGKLQTVHIQDPRTGNVFEAVARDDLQATGAKLPEPKKDSRSNYAEQEARWKEQRAREEAKAKAETDRRFELLGKVREAIAGQPRSSFDLRLIAKAAMRGVGWDDKGMLLALWDARDVDALHDCIDTMDADQLTRLVLDCALVTDVQVRGAHDMKSEPAALVAAAEHYGVQTPSSAAQAPKKAKARGAKSKKGEAAAAADEQKDDAGVAGEELEEAAA